MKVETESTYVQEARRMIHVIKVQLTELDEFRSHYEASSKEYKQITEIMDRLESEQKRFGSIVRSYVAKRITETIDSFRKDNAASKRPDLKIVK